MDWKNKISLVLVQDHLEKIDIDFQAKIKRQFKEERMFWGSKQIYIL